MNIVTVQIWRGFVPLLLCLLFWPSPTTSRCFNSTDFKYDLPEVTSISSYWSLCSQHAPRTCCSRDNLEFIAKKTSRALEGYLSHSCRQMLENLFCSSCDGDIGQQIRQGICLGYCQMIFEECKNDLFAIDSNNNMRVCREDDIICSELKEIVNSSAKATVCESFGFQINPLNCWNGQVTAVLKGKSQRVEKSQEKTSSKPTKPRSKPKRKPQKHKKEVKSQSKISSPSNQTLNPPKENEEKSFSDELKTYLSLVLLIGGIFGVIYLRKYYRKWKRQNRYK